MSNGSKPSATASRTPVPKADGFSVSDYWHLLRRHWHLLLLFTSLGMSLAVLYWFYTPRIFASTAQILVMRKESQLATTTGQGTSDGESRVSEDMLSTHV